MPNELGDGWTLDAEKWREVIEFAKLLKLTWLRCPFQQIANLHVPQTGGVYAIEYPSPLQCAPATRVAFQQLRAPIYIGKSHTNLRDRFESHTSPTPQDRIARVRCWPSEVNNDPKFIWTQISRIPEINKLEALLIDCFRPPCNKIGGVSLGAGSPAGSILTT